MTKRVKRRKRMLAHIRALELEVGLREWDEQDDAASDVFIRCLSTFHLNQDSLDKCLEQERKKWLKKERKRWGMK